MKHTWCVALALVLLSVVPGCSKKESAPVQAPTVATPDEANKPLTAADLRHRALGYMGAGDYENAIADWKRLVEAEPTADNWNDLSYAYLQARRYKEAAGAGEQALKLKQDHPYASYNTGVAYLENGEPARAEYFLQISAGEQPDRHEPQVALARVYQSMGRYALAAYFAAEAARIKGDAPEVKQVQAAVADMTKGALPPDLAGASVAQLKDGSVMLYLYPEQIKRGQYSLYVLFADGKFQKLPMSNLRPPDGQNTITKIGLPNGFTGYWIDVYRESIAYVAHSDGWVLLAVNGQTAKQVLFDSSFGLRDQLDSSEMPSVTGDSIRAAHMDGASGTVSMSYELQLDADMRVARQVAETGQLDGTILAVEGQAITVDPIRGSYNGQYQRTLTITDTTQIFQGSQTVTRAALAVGSHVSVMFVPELKTALRVDVNR